MVKIWEKRAILDLKNVKSKPKSVPGPKWGGKLKLFQNVSLFKTLIPHYSDEVLLSLKIWISIWVYQIQLFLLRIRNYDGIFKPSWTAQPASNLEYVSLVLSLVRLILLEIFKMRWMERFQIKTSFILGVCTTKIEDKFYIL